MERSLLSTAAGGWKQIIGQEAAMLNQIQSLAEVIDKIDSKEDLYSERAKFDLERSFSVSMTTPSGSPFTGKSRSESCKSRQSFSSRHSSVDTDCLLEADRNTISHHSLSHPNTFYSIVRYFLQIVSIQIYRVKCQQFIYIGCRSN